VTDEPPLDITHHSGTAARVLWEELLDVHRDAHADVLEHPFYSGPTDPYVGALGRSG
jgi:hypothetical protein